MKLKYKNLKTFAISALFTILSSTAHSQDVKREPNHLLGVQSPYLQQHLYNAVDWYPWGEEALAKAKNENKPIFLSVGYSTCHWCHVMARESFEDETIGQYLNENYVSIKIDRERRPDLDEQFMLATQAMTGRGGWPNSLFMTSDAKPFYAATYLPPELFMDVLNQINNLWKTDNSTLQQDAERVSSSIIGYLNQTEAAQSLTPEAIKDAASTIIEQADYFSGGLGTAPKFPQEAAMLLLLDQAERGNNEALEVVKSALDGMLKGGIHDHVGGGFHRYSVDAHWVVPHFEKMLYNQAMIGRLLVRAYELTGEYRYKHTAVRLLDYVIREMQNENGGFYSAQDADSLSETGEEGEGLFYIWSKEEFDKLDSAKLSAVKRIYEITEEGNFEGENILKLTNRIDEIAAESGGDEQLLYRELDVGLDHLRTIREKNKHAPHKDKKIVVSWNAMMIETMGHAAFVFDRPDYWKAAKASADYIVNSMLKAEGLQRVSFEGSIGVDGQLADYAGLGVALLALQDFTPIDMKKPKYIEVIRRLANEIRYKFADQKEFEGKPFNMTRKAEGLGKFAPFDDNPIPSGNSLALNLFNGIATHEGDLDFKRRTQILAATLSGYALASPQSRGTLVNVAYGINNTPVGKIRHIANGNVRIELKLDREKQEFSLGLHMKDGWHINSNKPLEEYFIPTALSVDGNPFAENDYPVPVEKKLQFNGTSLSLYEHNMLLRGEYSKKLNGQHHNLTLDVQACSDKICLEPESLSFNFWTK